MLLFIPLLQLLLGVLSNCRLELRLLERVLESEMIVLAHEREYECHEVALERKPRNDSFMKRFVSRQQDVDGDLEPGSFRSLAWVIKSG